MNALPGLELLAELGTAVLERRAPGVLLRAGPEPAWWRALVGSGRNEFVVEEHDGGGPLTMLAHFVDEAERVWAEGGEQRARSGMWVEEVGGERYRLEAEALSFVGRPLLLVRELGEEGREREEILRAVRGRKLDDTYRAQDRERLERELRRARDRAEELSRAKSTFLANMSHEIRTPLNAVLGLTDLLLEASPRTDQAEYLRLIRASGASLLDLINDILDLSRVEAGAIVLDERAVHLEGLLEELLGTLAVRAHAKGLELAYRIEGAGPEVVAVDPLRLRQVLVNLVGNAVKFTERGEVRVDVRYLAEGGVRFEVRDTGRGVPQEARRRIFEAFRQADPSVARTHGGTGLGLSIAARLVALMGGHLSLESEEGAGSSFFFELPLHATGGAALHAPPAAPQPHPARVLVSDPSAAARATMSRILTGWGCRVTAVSSLADAALRLAAVRGEGGDVDLVIVSECKPRSVDLAGARALAERFAPLRVGVCLATDERAYALRWNEYGHGPAIVKPAGPRRLAEALAPPPAAAPATEEGSAERRRLNVLLAEDHPVNQMLARAILTRAGHDVTLAEDGVAAVEHALRERFDVVLMDVQMPRMDGLEAARAIRRREAEGRRVPIVALTAHAMEEDRRACLEAGMDAYVGKPVRADELLDVVEALASGTSAPATG